MFLPLAQEQSVVEDSDLVELSSVVYVTRDVIFRSCYWGRHSSVISWLVT